MSEGTPREDRLEECKRDMYDLLQEMYERDEWDGNTVAYLLDYIDGERETKTRPMSKLEKHLFGAGGTRDATN